jgi:hypothetical protein
MHLEESRTLHAFEVSEMWHTRICDLVNMCIGEIQWMLWWCELCEDVYMMMFVIVDDACTLGEFIWRWLPCLYFWNDESYLLSWLGRSLYDLYDWCELVKYVLYVKWVKLHVWLYFLKDELVYGDD